MRNTVDIGAWQSYAAYTHPEQKKLQREHLTAINLRNRKDNHINFIFSEDMYRINEMVEHMLDEISVTDTETVLETEVYYTTKIEGAKTTRVRTSEIHNGQPIQKGDFSERMVKNCFEATKYMNIHGNRMSEEVLLETWKRLTDQACENRMLGDDGYRRSDDIIIGGYTPASYPDIPLLMQDFMAFYHSDELEDIPIIKACILHYAFETIHPFCDGNGRMGRLLVNNYLISRGFEAARAVSFSMRIDETRGAYDTAFVKSENIYNDCTPLIMYLLSDVMYEALESVYLQQKGRSEVFLDEIC